MRVSEHRYSRDLRRIHLAQRMIGYEARTQWICAWSGLSACRVRNLFQSHQATLQGPKRHRGPSSKRIASFLRWLALRAEASGAGALACSVWCRRRHCGMRAGHCRGLRPASGCARSMSFTDRSSWSRTSRWTSSSCSSLRLRKGRIWH